MIGLKTTQAEVYLAVIRLTEKSSLAPTQRDVHRQVKRRSSDVNRSIGVLIKRGFLAEDKFGGLYALPLPHEHIIDEVVSRSTVSRELLLGPSKDRRCIFLRHKIAKRLRIDHKYTYADIGKALNRSHRAVEEYFRSEEHLLSRAIWRRDRYLASKVPQTGLRMAA